ncbi:putative phosphothreonine lyase domain-containg protein [Nitrosomonas sp.]|uniref:putative phosphothreonine lyase domain-containing protein n=1 Tax=Nitrosomonas sp. TaxID=42353 RepID=UPI00261D50FA|nr:putative phosphothreonine lyase domain-containg protein [Nitrosomonas sp.]MCW5600413.1 DUF1917 domain-containing protein [Nitrosomonas sp.]
MKNKRVYGAKREYEADVVQAVEEGNPSKVTDAAFIVANYKGNEPMHEEINVGKWLFFVAEKYIDDTWRNVKKAVEDGKLWKHAKVSTAWRSRGGVYVLCVYTYDCGDEDDVMKIRAYLREMGFKRMTSYKSDEQTLAGIYSDDAQGGIALYKA